MLPTKRRCKWAGCREALGPRVQKWCPKHRELVRAEQLAKAQKRMLRRRKRHVKLKQPQVLRKGALTNWARENPGEAAFLWTRRNDSPLPPALVEVLRKKHPPADSYIG